MVLNSQLELKGMLQIPANPARGLRGFKSILFFEVIKKGLFGHLTAGNAGLAGCFILNVRKVFSLLCSSTELFCTPPFFPQIPHPVFPCFSMPSFTKHDLEQLGYTLQPDGSYSRAASHPAPPARLPDPKPQPPIRQTLDCQPPRKAARKGRVVVRITRHACRLLDADNYAGGCKPLIDQLRYAALIPDDDPASVELQFCQEKVAKKNLEAVTLEIIHP